MRQEKNIEAVLRSGNVAQQVLGLVRSPAWVPIQRYLRSLRAADAKKLIYVYRLPQNEQEMTVCQARIKLIDELLADTDESSLKLASDVADQQEVPTGSPFKVE